MRKLFLTLLFVPILCFAQINKTIWGVTLGKSTKQQVKTMLVNKGYTVRVEPDGSLYVDVNNISFGGAYWTYIAFSFVDGKLYQVWFQNNEKQSPVKIEEAFKKTKNFLNEKYIHYSVEARPSDTIEEVSDFADGKTYVSLMINRYHYQRYISLSYADLQLDNLKNKRSTDEL